MAESNQGHGVAADYVRLQRKRPLCPAPNPGATRQKSLKYGAANLTDQKNVSIWGRAHRKCLESAGPFKKTLESFWKNHLSVQNWASQLQHEASCWCKGWHLTPVSAQRHTAMRHSNVKKAKTHFPLRKAFSASLFSSSNAATACISERTTTFCGIYANLFSSSLARSHFLFIFVSWGFKGS